MLGRLSGRVALISALTTMALGCKGDPTASSAGAAVAIQTDYSSVNVAVGNTATFTAWVVDGLNNRLSIAVSFAACNGAVAAVANDTSYHAVPATSARAVVTGKAAGTTCTIVSGGGLKPDTVALVVS